MTDEKIGRTSVTFLATYPPRKCGIGTFTHDLATHVSQRYGEELSDKGRVKIAALNDGSDGYEYGPEVGFEINAQNKLDYRRAADYVNLSDTKVVNVQHEFGIFGGEDGENLLTFLDVVRKPVITTLHTILKNPSDHQREVLKEVCDLSTEVVVLANKGKELLRDVYDVSLEKVSMIHHGAPDVPFLDTSYYKEDYGFEGRSVILTFGLLGPNKGIEVAIEAMEEVASEFPDSLYVILGATHPHVKKERGEEYRLNLERMVRERGLQNNVAFHDMFVPLNELEKYLVTSDVYLTPYLSRDQISSGTLAYAVALGNAVVSTPYWYAEEMLADDRGKLVPFEDPEATAGGIIDLLSNERKRQSMRRNAYEFGRDMTWYSVAAKYQEKYNQAIKKYKKDVRVSSGEQVDPSDSLPDLPEINLDYLQALTDDTGIYQHASYTVPNRQFGYTTDDNARGALVALEQWKTFGEDFALELLRTYLSFLGAALDPETGRARNYMSFDRSWEREETTEDAHGRLVWAAGTLTRKGPNESLVGYGNQLFHRAIESVGDFTSPRSWAFSILGIRRYLDKFEGDRNTKLLGASLADKLLQGYKENSSEDWVWPEDSVTYENARLPQALICWGDFVSDEEMKDWGLKSLKWLMEIQTDSSRGIISLIGNRGWLVRGGEKADYDQQPVEVAALIDANWQAWKATGSDDYLENIYMAFNWFLGKNDLGVTLYDFRSGGCRDGLHPSRVNENEGAESALSWLMSLQRMYKLMGELKEKPRASREPSTKPED